MIIQVPSGSLDQLSDDEQKNVQVPTCNPKATFQWPPGCLWPFIDHGPEDDT
jgi:hypothetical protein